MKKAYNETWVENLETRSVAKNWLSKNLITDAQFESVKQNFTEEFYRPGLFVKIGLFFFAFIACSFFGGFVSLFVLEAGDGAIAIVGIICCVCFIFFLEKLIESRKLFHSGVDNALLYSAVIAALVPFFVLFDNLQLWEYCIVFFAIFLTATLRYADLLATACSFFAIATLIANLMTKFPLGKALLPFGLMIFSILAYLGIKKVKSIYYKESRTLIEVLSLITLYLGGNYYVVREGNALLNDLSRIISPQIAFAPLFYSFTLFLPLIYIVFGLKSKNRTLLLVGLFALGFSVFTYRYYFDFLSISQSLTLLGAAMIVVAVSGMRYLSIPKLGLTDEKDEERKLANLEAVLASQYLGQAPAEKSLEFGGGSFGGGGAGNEY